EKPAHGQLAIAPVPCGDGHAGVDAARHDERGALTVEVGYGGVEAVHTVSISISPDAVELAACRVPRVRMAGHHIGHGGQVRPRETIEDREILRPGENVSR